MTRSLFTDGPGAYSLLEAMGAPSSDGRPLVGDPDRLAALEALEVLDTAPEPAFDDIVAIAKALCDTPIALISLVDSDRQWFKARSGLALEETPIEQSVCACGLGSEDLLIIPDLAGDQRTADNALVTPPDGIRFYGGAPLVTEGGEVVGMLCVIDRKPRARGLTPQQQEGLAALARQTIRLLELRHDAQEREEELELSRRQGFETRSRAVRSERARRRLERMSRRQRTAQAAGRIGTFVIDVPSGIAQVSPELCDLFGVPVADSYHVSTFEALTVPEDQHLRSNTMTRVDASATPDVEYRIRRQSDNELRWIARRAAFERDEAGQVIRMAGTVHDVTERRIANDRMGSLVELGDGLRQVKTAAEVERLASALLGTKLDVSRVGYATVDAVSGHLTILQDWTADGSASAAGVYELAEIAATLDLIRDGSSLIVTDICAEGRMTPDIAFYRALGVAAQIVVPLIGHGKLVGLLFVHSAVVRSWSRRDIAFVESIADRAHSMLAKLSAEADQAVLHHELGHRLKNTLAMAASIASQTLRNVTEREAVEAFQKRLIALGKAHDVLLQESWASARMLSVVEGALGIFGAGNRVGIAGPNLTLGPRAALSLALVLHELGTNATKYGALSNDSGTVALTWRVEKAPDGANGDPALVLEWRESGGPPVSAPAAKGFGSRLIGMGITGAGGVVTHYAPTGFSAEFRAPLRTVAA